MQRLEFSGAVRPLYWSLGVKGLTLVRAAYVPFVEEVKIITFVQCTEWLKSYLTVDM